MGLNEIVKKAGELAQEVGTTLQQAADKTGKTISDGVEALANTILVIDEDKEKSLKNVSLVSYALYTAVALVAAVPGFQVEAFLLVVAFILDLWKKADARHTWLESHFSWRLESVIWAVVLYAVTAPLWLLFLVPGLVAWALISLWFLYRCVKGFIALGERQPMSS